jgi:hypothetical protein
MEEGQETLEKFTSLFYKFIQSLMAIIRAMGQLRINFVSSTIIHLFSIVRNHKNSLNSLASTGFFTSADSDHIVKSGFTVSKE